MPQAFARCRLRHRSGLQKRLSDRAVQDLQAQFADLFNGNAMVQCGALPEEQNEPELADVPRQLRGLTPQDAYVYALRDVLDAERQARANNTFTVNYDAVRDRLHAANIDFENLPLSH